MNKFYFDMNNTHDEATPGKCYLSENNLQVHINYASNIGTNIPVDKEKSYCEFKYFSCSEYGWIGFVSNNKTTNTKRLLLRLDRDGTCWINYNELSPVIAGINILPGSIVGLTFDKASKFVGVYFNCVFKSNVQLKTNESAIYPAIGCHCSWDSDGITAIANFGATPFAYPVPAGYLPMEVPMRKRLYVKDNFAYGMQ